LQKRSGVVGTRKMVHLANVPKNQVQILTALMVSKTKKTRRNEMENQLTTVIDDSALEQVLIGGDLSKLTPAQRVQYYKRTCESLGLNPLTRPFDYITLNNKLTLYAKKDATDQLRSIKNVSIDDVDLQEVGETFVVKVKGHDITGRSDVEIGVVRKSDMQGNLANAQMKAVTKAKRRLTLSLCGLGWLDETEVETIPDAKTITVSETGEIIDTENQSNHKPVGNKRPYDPETLKSRIATFAEKHANETASEGQRGLMVGGLNTCYAGEGADMKRHEALQFLTGEASSKKLPDNFVLAILDWLHLTQDSGGAYIPDQMAVREAQTMLTFARTDTGQKDLFEGEQA
jgi:hypothetical protein